MGVLYYRVEINTASGCQCKVTPVEAGETLTLMSNPDLAEIAKEETDALKSREDANKPGEYVLPTSSIGDEQTRPINAHSVEFKKDGTVCYQKKKLNFVSEDIFEAIIVATLPLTKYLHFGEPLDALIPELTDAATREGYEIAEVGLGLVDEFDEIEETGIKWDKQGNAGPGSLPATYFALLESGLRMMGGLFEKETSDFRALKFVVKYGKPGEPPMVMVLPTVLQILPPYKPTMGAPDTELVVKMPSGQDVPETAESTDALK